MVSTAGGIVIAILVLAIAGAVGWVVFTQMRARRLGLPPPPLKSYIPFAGSSHGGGGGIKGWFQSLRNSRSSGGGAYEQPLQGGAGRRGFGPLDPDEAWDSRVGHEADTYGPYGAYDEQDVAGAGSSYSGAAGARGGADSYDMNIAGDAGAGDSRGRQPGGRNPFEDDAEPSNMGMRGVSPRPLDTGVGGAQGGAQQGDSPSERRSMFRENV